MIFVLGLLGCLHGGVQTWSEEGTATLRRPLSSPSGEYIAIPMRNRCTMVVLVTDPQRAFVHATDQTFHCVGGIAVTWDNADRLWVYSGDTGYLHTWGVVDGGKWERLNNEELPVPVAIRHAIERWSPPDHPDTHPRSP